MVVDTKHNIVIDLVFSSSILRIFIISYASLC